MKYFVYIFFGGVIFFSSCNNNGDKQFTADQSDTTESVTTEKDDTSLTEETIAFINATDFSKYAHSKSLSIDWNKFNLARFWKEELRIKSSFVPEKNYFDTYGKFLKYSPDSLQFIDLDSYNIGIHKDKNGILIGNEEGPDSEVSLIDVKNKQKMRLVFLGPGSSVEDAAWLDKNNFILIGFQENESASGTNAVIWYFDLRSQLVKQYELKDESDVKDLMEYSKKVRLKDVRIQ